MLVPCETAIKHFLPAVKANIAKELTNRYNFNQIDTASKLDITQAAVSKYLSSDYSDAIKRVEKKKKVGEISKKIAFSIVKERVNKQEIGNLFCKYCKQFLGSTC